MLRLEIDLKFQIDREYLKEAECVTSLSALY